MLRIQNYAMHPVLLAQKFRRCESGVTAVEFAIIAPVFILLLCACVEYSLILFADATLESSLDVAARDAKTGYYKTHTGNTGNTTFTWGCSPSVTELQYVSNIVTKLAGGTLISGGGTPPAIVPPSGTTCSPPLATSGLYITECTTPMEMAHQPCFAPIQANIPGRHLLHLPAYFLALMG